MHAAPALVFGLDVRGEAVGDAVVEVRDGRVDHELDEGSLVEEPAQALERLVRQLAVRVSSLDAAMTAFSSSVKSAFCSAFGMASTMSCVMPSARPAFVCDWSQ